MDRAPVIVTGSSGFIGRALCHELARRGVTVIAASRSSQRAFGEHAVALLRLGDLTSESPPPELLAGARALVHLAGRAHVAEKDSAVSRQAFWQANAAGTERLARAAARAGVRRFVLASTLKVNGEHSLAGVPFTEEDPPGPRDAYAISKLAAERVLSQVAQETGIESVVVRPPLVYGPGVRGNFLRLIEMVDRDLPLPLGRVSNLRSLIYVGNLVDALCACIDHPRAAGRMFLVSDGDDLSTAELVRRLACALRRRCRLPAVPLSVLRGAGILLGQSASVARLTDSLQARSTHIRETLGWRPPFSVDQGLAATAEWYRGLRQPQ